MATQKFVNIFLQKKKREKMGLYGEPKKSVRAEGSANKCGVLIDF